MAEPRPEHLRALGPGGWSLALLSPILQSGGGVDPVGRGRGTGAQKLDTFLLFPYTPQHLPHNADPTPVILAASPCLPFPTPILSAKSLLSLPTFTQAERTLPPPRPSPPVPSHKAPSLRTSLWDPQVPWPLGLHGGSPSIGSQARRGFGAILRGLFPFPATPQLLLPLIGAPPWVGPLTEWAGTGEQRRGL